MKIDGKERDWPMLTIGALREAIDRHLSTGWLKATDLVHILNYQDSEDDSYATHVEADCFETDTGDDDGESVRVLSIMVYPSKARRAADEVTR